jgi:hypothetical protein
MERHFREKQDHLTFIHAAKKLGITDTSLRNYAGGERIPQQDTAARMGDCFYGKGSDEAKEFADRINQLRFKAGTPDRRTSVLDRLGARFGSVKGSGQIRFISHTLPPFSGDDGCFLDRLLTRLVRSGGLESVSVEMESKNSPKFDIRRAIANETAELAVGYFTTLEYSVAMHCWTTPFKICLGAVLAAKDKEKRQAVQRALLERRSPNEPHPRLCVFVLQHDVGATYMQSLQALNLGGIVVQPLENLEQIAEKMHEPTLNEIHVALLNEFTSFSLLEKISGVPVFPLSSRKAARDSKLSRSSLPAYRLNIACHRKQTSDFRDLIDQMLSLFLRTEIESTSSDLARLFHEKEGVNFKQIEKAASFYEEYQSTNEKEAKSLQFNAAYHWLLYALGLDRFSNRYPNATTAWTRIRARTRERILSQFAYDPSIDDQERYNREQLIRDQIKLIVKNDDDELSRNQLRAVEDAFDIDLKLNDIELEYTRKDRGIAVRALQNIAQNLPVGMPLEFKRSGGTVKRYLPPLDKPTLRVVDGCLSEVQRFYSDNVSEQELKEVLNIEKSEGPVERLTKFRHNMLDRFGIGQFSHVILASIGNEKSPLYIGGAFLGPCSLNASPDSKALAAPQESLMLSYLWTHSRYRNLGVATYIINDVVEYARKETGFKFLVIEIFRTLNEQVSYFQKQGFEYDSEVENTGRLVFRRPLRTASMGGTL